MSIYNGMKIWHFKGYYAFYKLTRPRTVWWTQKNGIREDSLLSFTRAYERETKTYMYKFFIGRILIGCGKFNN
jgi:hypothetical protein